MNEEWRVVEGHLGYEVSSAGRVRSINRIFIKSNGSKHTVRERILRGGVDSKGYPTVMLSAEPGSHRTRYRIHKLVSVAFLGARPDGMEVRHLNGCKTDNRKENLCYGTRQENAMDMHRHGTMPAKLSEDNVKSIKNDLSSGIQQIILAEKYGVSKSTISRIYRGASWSHV